MLIVLPRPAAVGRSAAKGTQKARMLLMDYTTFFKKCMRSAGRKFLKHAKGRPQWSLPGKPSQSHCGDSSPKGSAFWPVNTTYFVFMVFSFASSILPHAPLPLPEHLT